MIPENETRSPNLFLQTKWVNYTFDIMNMITPRISLYKVIRKRRSSSDRWIGESCEFIRYKWDSKSMQSVLGRKYLML